MASSIISGTALVTGASSGIGRAIAIELAPRVSKLLLVARRVDRLEALREELVGARPELEVQVLPCDLTDATEVAKLAEAAGAVDVLVNNAGLGDIGLFDLQDWAKTERMLLVNINALTQLTRLFVSGMVERKKGAVLNISSGFGMTWLPGVAAYAGSKHYVTAFTEALRLEVKGQGVVVTQVCPGPVATEFEAVAGNPTGQEVPGWIQITAEHCAQASVAGLARRKAVVVPGLVMKLTMLSAGFVPRWLYRLSVGWMAGYLRRRAA